jgi:hypothetical protein
MNLPFEMIDSIYRYCNTDTQLLFHKIFGYKSFKACKLNIDKNFKKELEQIISIRYFKYIINCQIIKTINII